MSLKIKLLLLGLMLSFSLSAKESAKESAKKPTILALSPHVVELLFAIGAGEQIIATTDHADYPEAAKKIPSVGNYARLQIERVLELQPDLIIAWKTGNPSDDLARLQKLGFTIAYSHPKTLDDVAKELRHFGQLSGHVAQANQVAAAYDRRLEKIRQQYQSKSLISVFYELWARPLSTIAKDSWPQLHLDVCRAKNPFFDAVNSYPQVGIEQVLAHDVQLIIQPLSVNQKDKEGFNWQDWGALTAVKHHQLITPDADQLHRMTPRVLDELAVLCQQIDQSRRFYLNKKGSGQTR